MFLRVILFGIIEWIFNLAINLKGGKYHLNLEYKSETDSKQVKWLKGEKN